MKNRKGALKSLSIVLIFAQLVSAIAGPTYMQAAVNETDGARYGDVNDDGVIDSDDVELLARYLADDTTVSINTSAADIDRNKEVDLKDLSYLVKSLKGDDGIELGETVQISFDTNGGEPIEPITVIMGGTITVPEAQKDKAIFLGWYVDENFETPFYGSDPILQDITIYAKYQEVEGTTEYTPTAYALRDQAPDITFEIERISGDAIPEDAVSIRNVDGSVTPELAFVLVEENRWQVSAVGGFKEGASYSMVLADGYVFADKEESIREASFYIHKEEVVNFMTNEDIIYIQDTDSMTYALSDGTFCDVLSSGVLYNSDDVITGEFTYDGEADINVGDTLCIYMSTHPNERDYINGDYENDPAAYIVIEGMNGTTLSFRGMSMQGEESDVEKLIAMPNTIPYSVVVLPEGDGTIDFADHDVAAIYSMYGTNAPEEVKVGDFLAFYVGAFGSLREGDEVVYKRVTHVEGTSITYVASTQEELMDSVNLFLADSVDGDTMLENIDQEQLEAQVMQQVAETHFAEDAVQYLADVVLNSEEFLEYVADNKIVVYDENGMQLTEEQVRAYGLGKSFELGDDVEIGFNVTKCDGENSHFEDGLKVTLQIGAEFEVNIGKDGKMGSLKIELGAAFTQEVFIDVSINANADITWVVIVPVIHDIVFSSAVDAMSYTGVSLEAKFYTQEPSEDFFDKLKEAWGDKLGKENLEKIEAFKKKYEDKFGEDSLGEDIEGFWEAQTTLIEEIIKSGTVEEEALLSCMESTDELNVMQTFYNNIGLMNDEEYGAGITDLAERYSDMLSEEDNGWLELCKIKIFEVPINLFLFEINIEGDFVVRANINIALGANMEYEIGKRYINWFSIFGKGSGSSEIDLIDERFAFQFYAMGYIGVKVGVLIEVKVGIISTKIGYVGIAAEFGAYADLYGYFQYTYTKYRPANGKDWDEEESMIGAIYFEFGLYLDINLNASLLSILEKEWELYSDKWAILSAGVRENVYGFATELEEDEKYIAVDEDGNSTNGILGILSEDFRSMKTLDMTSGDMDDEIKPWISYYGYNFWEGDDYSLTNREDKTNFAYSFSSKYFKLVPVYKEEEGKTYLVDYKIEVDVPEGVHYLACDLRIVWCLDKLCWSKYDIDLTIPVVWTDLSDEELNEYKTATVKVGNTEDGYRTVWSKRYLKGEEFTLPKVEDVLKYAGYAGENDVQYSGYTGYTSTNRGENITSEEQMMTFDTIYYFDMTKREYTIVVNDVQNEDGSLTQKYFTAKYGDSFDFSSLATTGTNKDGTYMLFSGIEEKDRDGNVTLRDLSQPITGNFANAILKGETTYHAKYVDNSSIVTYKFTGLLIDPIQKVYKNGEIPSQDDFTSAIKGVNEMAYVTDISPAFSDVQGDTVYTISVAVPEKPLESYTITYESNGGSTVLPSTIVERSIMTRPQNPTRLGYSFAGWYYDEELTYEVDWTRPMPSMNFTLYAKWNINTYKITFDAGEGSSVFNQVEVEYGKKIGTMPEATRENYKFLGWYDALTGGTKYTEDTIYTDGDDKTLYARWELKKTISKDDIDFEIITLTYDGEGHKADWFCNSSEISRLNFEISYKRQVLDRNWSTEIPVNAGTYDIRVQRAEDDEYLAFEYVYTSKVIIQKRSRTISVNGLGAEAYYANLMATSIPSYEGDGTPMYAIEKYNNGWTRSNWQTSAGFMNLAAGKYRMCFYVEEGENYQASNMVVLGTEYSISAPGISDFKPMSYQIFTKTASKVASETQQKTYVRFVYTDGSEGSAAEIATGVLGKESKDMLSDAKDPWLISGVRYNTGYDKWICTGNIKVTPYIGGNATSTYSYSAGEFSLKDSSKTINFGNDFKRRITSVGDFNTSVSLDLNDSDGIYTYVYDGKVVDQYSSWTTNGSYYNAYAHTHAPVLTFVCSTPEVNGHNYEQYFRSSIRTVTIDRDGLYRAMRRDGVSTITATATLTFDSASTSSGNVWTKTFTITLPEAVAVSEDMQTYFANTNGSVSVQTEEKEDYVVVRVGLEQNPGIWGIKNTIFFDAEKLSLEQVEMGELTSKYEIVSSMSDGKYVFVGYRDDVRESYQLGNFVTLTFKKLTDSVIMSEAVSVHTNQAINDQAQSANVDTYVNIGDFSSIPPVDNNVYWIDNQKMVEALLNQLEARNTDSLTVYYATDELITSEMISEWFHKAANMLETYDYFGIEKYTATAQKYTKENVYYYTLTYKIDYYTTNDQEVMFETKLQEIVDGMNLSSKSDLDKVFAVYDYICENVTYDESADNCFTAYGALIEEKAVCQGYALLLMRMLQYLSVEAEVVYGQADGINHMWNIVKLDGEYFLLDSTWDSQKACYLWFLKGSDDFENHTPEIPYGISVSTDDHSDALSLSHTFGESTCESPATCTECGITTGTSLGHQDTNKDHVCDNNCGKVDMGQHKDADKDHVCDYGCAEVMGEHKDVDKNHVCDYGCTEIIGEHKDIDKNHVCDYGCAEAMGEHKDVNKDHVCDYGCVVAIGEHKDVDKNHVCDYGCIEIIGEHKDIDKDHVCDYGCAEAIGEHKDIDKNHVCDYGCAEVVGEHKDANKDHACDYGCVVVVGEHKDNDGNHVCDYGCAEAIGEHKDVDKNHICDYGCAEAMGKHEDTNKDHVCDYGCTEAIGTHEDKNKDHACDYGCAEAIGTHEDTNKDHACDYGCTEIIGEHKDIDKNHACDYGCAEAMGEHKDVDKNHICDYGCPETMGEHKDINKDHVCDYGCTEAIGTHADENKDHACDYGCAGTIGKHEDANKDHACDYGCTETIGEHKDANKDHACDYGCKEVIGTHEDTNKDHVCDYGCTEGIGTHEDTNKDHVCDYGCAEAMGEHKDGNKDHVCDYGCAEVIGEHKDANKDHACDYGCTETIGTHEDANKDHTCDYGCTEIIGEHKDIDKNHACDYGCAEAMGEHKDANKDHVCDYGCVVVMGEHKDNDGNHVCDYGCAEAIGEHKDVDKNHICDYGCPEAMGKHEDTNKDHVCDYGCTEAIGTHEDTNKDHVCDYGFEEVIGTHEDTNKDHVCDYGCTEGIGTHEDTNKDHACDYGCAGTIGKHEDSNKDHACDYGCTEAIGEHKDSNKDHACDYGCEEVMGTHEDTNKDHVCDYGCEEAIGEHKDANKDHACDYGCTETIGTHEDANKDHTCDYGCAEVMGTHEDTNKDHACDYGCAGTIGKHEDANKDHACDYGCTEIIGEHKDIDKNHACDYGCAEAMGEHKDANKDHACDYGCTVVIGTHEDTNKDHVCDYGCTEAIGTHEDTNKDHACDYGCAGTIGKHEDSNKDHACDYGCTEAIGEHKDSNKDHACDYGCEEVMGTHEDTNKDHVCDYGCEEVMGTHEDTNKDHVCDYGCEEAIGEHKDANKDYVCDYGCAEAMGEPETPKEDTDITGIVVVCTIMLGFVGVFLTRGISKKRKTK